MAVSCVKEKKKIDRRRNKKKCYVSSFAKYHGVAGVAVLQIKKKQLVLVMDRYTELCVCILFNTCGGEGISIRIYHFRVLIDDN